MKDVQTALAGLITLLHQQEFNYLHHDSSSPREREAQVQILPLLRLNCVGGWEQSPRRWEMDKRAGQGASCVGEKVANEGISLYELDNFCIRKPLRKSWLRPSMEGEHRLQPLYYGLPQMAEAFCRAAEHGCCGGNQHGQGLTHQQPEMTTHGGWEKQGHSLELDFAEQCPPRMPSWGWHFGGKQGLGPGTAPSHLTGVSSTWKRVLGLSWEAA